jgi:hypothetical protein
MTALYELSADLLALEDRLADMPADATPETVQALMAEYFDTTEARDEKAGTIARMVKANEAEAGAIDIEIERLVARREARKRRAVWYRAYLFDQMVTMGVTKIATPLFNLRIQDNSQPTVRVTDQNAIPRRFQIVMPPTIKIDTAAIREAAAGGEVIDGVEVVRGSHLRIS